MKNETKTIKAQNNEIKMNALSESELESISGGANINVYLPKKELQEYTCCGSNIIIMSR